MLNRTANLQAQRAQETGRLNAQFSDNSFFEEQMSRSSSTRPSTRKEHGLAPVAHLMKSDTETSQDILDQINGNRPVDTSSYYPPPVSPKLLDPLGWTSSEIPSQLSDQSNQHTMQSRERYAQSNEHSRSEEDDILGDLGKPVELLAQMRKGSPPREEFYTKSQDLLSSSSHESSDDEDIRRAKAESLEFASNGAIIGTFDPPAALVQQLVDMGYSAAQARAALVQTENGSDLGAAIDLLLSSDTVGYAASRKSSRAASTTTSNRLKSSERRIKNAEGDWVDSTYDLASKTLASANSWLSNKSALARRKLAEFNAENAVETHASRFDERPKWMKDAERYERKDKGKSKARDEVEEHIREEGLPMHPSERRRLEMNGVLPTSPRRGSVDSEKSAKSLSGSILSIPESLRTIGTTITGGFPHGVNSSNTARTSITPAESRKFKANDDEAATFVSSRRRRPAAGSLKDVVGPAAIARPTGTVPNQLQEHEEDLFGSSSVSPRKDKGKGKSNDVVRAEDDIFAVAKAQPDMRPRQVDIFSSNTAGKQTESSSSQQRRRKNQRTRQIPYLDPTMLAKSSQQRMRGSEFFKKGDFAQALSCYESSLLDIPTIHPIRVLSLTNKAITQIHLGAPKPAIETCDEALQIIGEEKGQGEVVEDAGKQTQMSSLWAKAMSRKASALEMQERNSDALEIWQELVRSGLGGPSAIQSRQHCENMLAPKVAKSAPVKSGTASSKPSQASQAAVRKLREDDARTAQAEAQKDSLYGTVNDRITAWSNGKESNLRALLSSLDQVLWPTSGWKKVGLGDLVINSKVKVIYMKALAKVHPDKISREASVEEKMIAAGVFAKLNGAWDSFKTQNNM